MKCSQRQSKVEKWQAEADKLKADGKSLMFISVSVGRSYDTIKRHFRKKRHEPSYIPPPSPELPVAPDKVFLEPDAIREYLSHRLQRSKQVDIGAFCKEYDLETKQAWESVLDLLTDGMSLDIDRDRINDSGTIALRKTLEIASAPYERKWEGETKVKFGVVSDTHLCSNFQQLSFLRAAYEHFRREEIHTVYHAGDITDGYGMRRGHEYEVFVHGADGQVDYVYDKYPKVDGIETVLITGNHDLSHVTNAGYDIGRTISHRRKDIIYLGPELAKIKLTPSCTLELWHGRDGSSYATSYAIQKYVEAIPGGDKPNILFAGHRHKAIYLPFRNVHSFEAGCLQAQTGFMRGKKLYAAVGYWIVELAINPTDGTINELTSRFIPLYVMKQNDFE